MKSPKTTSTPKEHHRQCAKWGFTGTAQPALPCICDRIRAAVEAERLAAFDYIKTREWFGHLGDIAKSIKDGKHLLEKPYHP